MGRSLDRARARLALILALFISAASPAQAEKRVALIIGNGARGMSGKIFIIRFGGGSIFAAYASDSWTAMLGASPFAQVQLYLMLLPHRSCEIAVLLAASTVRAFGGALPPPTPSGDF
jgi:hypothetical protein